MFSEFYYVPTRPASVAGVFVSGQSDCVCSAAAFRGNLVVPSSHHGSAPPPRPPLPLPLLTRRLAFIPAASAAPPLLTSLLAGQPANDPAHSGSPETRFNRSSGRDWVRKSEAEGEEGEEGMERGRKRAAGRWLLYAPTPPPSLIVDHSCLSCINVEVSAQSRKSISALDR